MSDRLATLTRLKSDENVTLGRLTAFERLERVFDLAIVELPWLWNQPFRSCIPVGTYRLIQHYSDNLGDCYRFEHVPGRTEICQHSANHTREIEGCQAPGLRFADIDGDGIIDAASSRDAMQRLLAWGGDTYMLYITGVAG